MGHPTEKAKQQTAPSPTPPVLLPVEKKRTFKQDILLSVLTAVCVGIVSFFGMAYQLRQAKQRDRSQAKDQIFKEVVKSVADYRIAAIDYEHAEVTERTDVFIGDFNNAIKDAAKPYTNFNYQSVDTNKFIETVLNAKIYGVLARKDSPLVEETRRHLGEATAHLDTSLKIATAYFSYDVVEDIAKFYNIGTDPHGSINLDNYKRELLDAMMSGEKDRPHAVLEHIMRDDQSSLDTNIHFSVLSDIVGAMREELRHGK